MNPPVGWQIEHARKPSASIRNEEYELSLKISPIYRSSVSRGRGKAQSPKKFQVKIQQDWFSSGMYGDHTRAIKVEKWEEAVETAMRFMQEFNDDRKGIPSENVETVHRSSGNVEAAEANLSVEAATGAMADVAGYSDDLLIDTIATETNGQFRVVAHRDGDEIEYLRGEDDESLQTVQLEKVYAMFPIDKLGINSCLSDDSIFITTITISGLTVYRFVFDDQTETDIILDQGTEVVNPVFTNSVKQIVELKWDSPEE